MLLCNTVEEKVNFTGLLRIRRKMEKTNFSTQGTPGKLGRNLDFA